MPVVIAQSELTCPQCGHQELLIMPSDACQWFYQCPQCKTLLKPLAGDCCVFCSYGTVPCPPIQLQRVDLVSTGNCCNLNQ